MRKAPLNRVPLARRIQVISCLVEGNSIRSPERMTGTHRDTICLLLVEIGDGRAKLMGAAMRIHNLYEDTDGKSHFRDVGGRLGFEFGTPAGDRHRVPRDHRGLREQLAPGAAPAIRDQPGGRDLDHRDFTAAFALATDEPRQELRGEL